MKKFALFFILTILDCTYTQITIAQEYIEGNTYYDNNGKAYYYDENGKAFYYPEPVEIENITDNTQANTNIKTQSKQPNNINKNIFANSKNLISAEWWKTATVEDVEAEIAAGVDVNMLGSDRAGKKSDGDLRENVTPLMYALKYGNPSIEVIKALINAGADVNAKEKVTGLTVLMYAAEVTGNPKIIETLIKHGSNIEAKNNDGFTVLMLAAGNATNPEIIETLIKHGANVNAKRDDGSTALMVAATLNENPEIIKALLNAGADVNAKNNDGWTALMLAAKNSNPEIIETLIKHGANVNAKMDDGGTPLMYAAGNNEKPEVVKVLIDAGADVNAKDKYGGTPLMHAARNNEKPEVVKVLIDAGADIGAYVEHPISTAALAAMVYNSNHQIFAELVKPEIDNFCRLNNNYSEDIYYCKDRLILYFQKEHQLPSCTYNMTAVLAITPFLQAIPDAAPGKGTYALVIIGNMMSNFNCSFSNTFKTFAGL